ncbi:hypothetical protein METBIDRAFT_99069 [Metschnikowia bicuspidata var. bicuspidata NRRL YB-4993]|uniref:Uncharacterized protein n=1 Tax=Metschnikowia bicuspidata var. bicuspidata NRRL YB-4993 TaxID=869754 RepID=A0A1A0HGY7_9ASCO|nr:hypothetical protein METBIDRAFT_99069 [Metschnikowia bicuspidata var. bicuspidata NRRL YB-4993]OBA23113.1 hypothetical protein METBIDRAFT_99069 [Metschnikowia bicuspidata var. bicuspidata NRRL YB-4993]
MPRACKPSTYQEFCPRTIVFGAPSNCFVLFLVVLFLVGSREESVVICITAPLGITAVPPARASSLVGTRLGACFRIACIPAFISWAKLCFA